MGPGLLPSLLSWGAYRWPCLGDGELLFPGCPWRSVYQCFYFIADPQTRSLSKGSGLPEYRFSCGARAVICANPWSNIFFLGRHITCRFSRSFAEEELLHFALERIKYQSDPNG